jgi:hypothetical protein
LYASVTCNDLQILIDQDWNDWTECFETSSNLLNLPVTVTARIIGVDFQSVDRAIGDRKTRDLSGTFADTDSGRRDHFSALLDRSCSISGYAGKWLARRNRNPRFFLDFDSEQIRTICNRTASILDVWDDLSREENCISLVRSEVTDRLPDEFRISFGLVLTPT